MTYTQTQMDAMQQMIAAAVREALSTASHQVSGPLAPANTRSDEQTEILDAKALCQRLQISEPTLIKWRQKGKIPSFNIGRAIRYDYPKVLAALQEKKKGGKK